MIINVIMGKPLELIDVYTNNKDHIARTGRLNCVGLHVDLHYNNYVGTYPPLLIMSFMSEYIATITPGQECYLVCLQSSCIYHYQGNIKIRVLCCS